MLYKNEYQIGDQVKSTTNNSIGYIKCIIETSSDDRIRYEYLVLSNENKYFVESEAFLKLIKKVSLEDDSESVKKLRSFTESHVYESDLKVGDIVKFGTAGPIGQFVVSSIIEMRYGEELWHYELIPIYNGELDSEVYCVCGRLMLELEYHDTNWEEYFTEGTRQNGLPVWRGGLYNLYELYVNPNRPNIGFTNVADDYNNDTIPPIYMKHILDRHTIFGRIDVVLGSMEKPSENKNIIMTKLKFNKEKLNAVRDSIEEKIMKRNGVGYVQGDNVHFTSDEMRLVEQIDLLDTESTTNGEQHHVDHFNLELRNIDIMKMIQQAYKSARKVKGRVLDQTSKDKRTGDVNLQNLGKVDYEGVSKDDTVIRFTYDFDVNVIDTAYPLRMNSNTKKH